jgi:dTDP-4-amino-4,6-dideoxygalactose transaminase
VIPFLQLTPGEDAASVRDAVERVIARGWFILGPELDAFEREFAAASGAAAAVGVDAGTDALAIFGRSGLAVATRSLPRRLGRVLASS